MAGFWSGDAGIEKKVEDAVSYVKDEKSDTEFELRLNEKGEKNLIVRNSVTLRN